MLQSAIVGLIFCIATFYVVRLIYKSFQSKSVCESGCAKCGALDLAKIEKQLKEKGY